MSAEAIWGMVPPPMEEPLDSLRPENWKHLDDSVNAMSFGFVATAILISMFLLLAVFEKFLRQRSTESSARTPMDLEDQMGFRGKLQNLSPKLDDHLWERCISVDARGANSFIHCTPCSCSAPCRPESITWPIHYPT